MGTERTACVCPAAVPDPAGAPVRPLGSLLGLRGRRPLSVTVAVTGLLGRAPGVPARMLTCDSGCIRARAWFSVRACPAGGNTATAARGEDAHPEATPRRSPRARPRGPLRPAQAGHTCRVPWTRAPAQDREVSSRTSQPRTREQFQTKATFSHDLYRKEGKYEMRPSASDVRGS